MGSLIVPLGVTTGGMHKNHITSLLQDSLLIEVFDIPVEVVAMVPRRVVVDPSMRLKLCATAKPAKLGGDLILGSGFLDEQGKFQLRIGPLSLAQFRSLLPDGPLFRKLVELTRFYVGPEFAIEVRLVLKPEAVSQCTLGSSPENPSRLGWNAWFKSSEPGREYGTSFESPI